MIAKSVHVGENPMRTGLLFLGPCKSPQSDSSPEADSSPEVSSEVCVRLCV